MAYQMNGGKTPGSSYKDLMPGEGFTDRGLLNKPIYQLHKKSGKVKTISEKRYKKLEEKLGKKKNPKRSVSKTSLAEQAEKADAAVMFMNMRQAIEQASAIDKFTNTPIQHKR